MHTSYRASFSVSYNVIIKLILFFFNPAVASAICKIQNVVRFRIHSHYFIITLIVWQVTGTHNDEEGLHRRLAIYRELNQEDESVINYFDELEIFPEKIG